MQSSKNYNFQNNIEEKFDARENNMRQPDAGTRKE